jgi:hypothetical protein
MGLFAAAEATMADIAARVAALEGGAVEPPVEPPPVTYTPSGTLTLATGSVIERKSFTDLALGIKGTSNSGSIAINGAAIRDCLLTRCADGIKIGSGPQSSGITIERVTAVDCIAPLFLANISDSTFTDLDIDATPAGGYDHCAYLERGLIRCTFRNMRLTRGGGYCLHLYHETGADCEDLLFEDCIFDARGGGKRAMVIYPGCKRITMRRCKFLIDRADEPVIVLAGAVDVLVEDFEAQGGYALVEGFYTNSSNVVFRNGVYRSSSPFVVGKTAGISFQNVVRA